MSLEERREKIATLLMAGILSREDPPYLKDAADIAVEAADELIARLSGWPLVPEAEADQGDLL